MSARLEEARRVSVSLLDDLEGGTAPVEGVLMKAKRLARLMRDADAQIDLVGFRNKRISQIIQFFEPRNVQAIRHSERSNNRRFQILASQLAGN